MHEQLMKHGTKWLVPCISNPREFTWCERISSTHDGLNGWSFCKNNLASLAERGGVLNRNVYEEGIRMSRVYRG
jgi:hypothetical protein